MTRKAILHIGPMKTGSTSIQFWLNRQASDLAKRGFYSPMALGGRNMSRLTYMAEALAIGAELESGDATRLDALRTEIATLPAHIHTVIFSGEMLGQLLREAAQVSALKSVLNEYFQEFRIILYLRRQDESSLSRYTTALRRGQRGAKPLGTAVNYERMLTIWSEVFGREAVIPRMFDRKTMPQGDVTRDFITAAGLPMMEDDEKLIDRNPSLRPEAQAFLADLAARLRKKPYELRLIDIAGLDELNNALSRDFKGSGVLPLRAEVLAFYNEIRASNERVRVEWFPERKTLFSEDFTKYPEVSPPEANSSAVLDVAMTALVAVLAARDKLVGGSQVKAQRIVKPDRQARAESAAQAVAGLGDLLDAERGSNAKARTGVERRTRAERQARRAARLAREALDSDAKKA